MENDLISRSALLAKYCDGCEALEHGLCDQDICGTALLITKAPAVDAVEVVRCKDCQHMYSPGWCEWNDRETEENDFCKYGERRK